MGRMDMFIGLAAAGTTGGYGIARYSFHRAVMRGNARYERTQKMTGADWDAYIPGIRASKEWLAEQEKEDVFITSTDGLRLHETFFPCEGSKRAVVCLHEYTSERLSDFSSTAGFYPEKEFNLMVTGKRAHGKSEGTYTGFGCLNRHDALGQIRYVISRLGQDCELMLRGTSVGGTTTLIAAGLTLPPQVRVAVSNCVFTPAWEVFNHALRSMYHMPAFPVMQIVDRAAREEAGYSLNEYNVRDKVERAKILILFIYGDKDAFVPCSMVYDLYNACRSPKSLLVASGTSHTKVYYKDTEDYKNAMNQLVHRYLDH